MSHVASATGRQEPQHLTALLVMYLLLLPQNPNTNLEGLVTAEHWGVGSNTYFSAVSLQVTFVCCLLCVMMTSLLTAFTGHSSSSVHV